MGCQTSLEITNTHLVDQKTNPREADGETPIYRNASNAEGPLKQYFNKWPEVTTLQGFVTRICKNSEDQDCCGTREVKSNGAKGKYKFKSYGEVKKICDQLGTAILKENFYVEDTEEDIKFVGVWAKNREEVFFVDHACSLYKLVMLSFYAKQALEEFTFALKNTHINTFFVSHEHVDQLIKGVKAKVFTTLKNIICFDPIPEHQRKEATNLGLKIIDFKTVVEMGKDIAPYPKINPDDIAFACFTSGTTGFPKIVLHSHKAVIAAIAGQEAHPDISVLPIGTKYISFLPMANITERIFTRVMLARGGNIGFYSGNIRNLREDFTVLNPDVICGIPMVFNRFYEKLKSKIAELSDAKRKQVKEAIDLKLKNLREKGEYSHWYHDYFIFDKMREYVGKKVKLMICGQASLSPHVGLFLQIAFSCPIIEDYGTTETCSGQIFQLSKQRVSGDVGIPAPHCEYKLVNVPDMNYLVTDRDEKGKHAPSGEILIRSTSLFSRYYKDPERTKRKFDEDGFYKTGDIGTHLPSGALQITDRRKNIFQMANGECIAADKVETSYLSSRYVSEAFVYGDNKHQHAVAVVSPEEQFIVELGKDLGLDNLKYEELLESNKIRAEVLRNMNKCAAKDLNLEVLAKNVKFEPKSFAALGLISPGLKVKRKEMKDYYEDVIEEMYKNPLEIEEEGRNEEDEKDSSE